MTTLTLEQYRTQFAQRRFLAMPLTGMLVWTAMAVTGALLPPQQAIMALFIGTGSIVYLAMAIARLTGEKMSFKKSQKNPFDSLFLYGVVMAALVYAIAIPYFLADYRSLPFSIGILTGLMWLPLGWIIQHWIGLFHTLARTACCTVAWIVAPEHSFVTMPLIIVAIYAISIVTLERRWRKLQPLNTLTAQALAQ
ncbi:hypothetical protein SAMN06297280_1246 [Arsukibacterium tuosuense]|uniref:Uncharacterized protein n=1 Tax=Arsukibacterium tuosuense TaxID=1323745 RepID=A0A285IM73_9GAMM|nr:hypothetical protein [Arsukibacterium tuosuense]SNY49078.1 hypothetical protein SAMN06297280_1246 [Arsukibacterium tuosuense]